MEGWPLPVNLSIKNVPDRIAEGLRERAARSHRSIQGELMSIIEAAVMRSDRPTARNVLERVRRLKLKTGDEALAILRADRDRR